MQPEAQVTLMDATGLDGLGFFINISHHLPQETIPIHSRILVWTKMFLMEIRQHLTI
jgi:hypothetical protein